MCYWPHTYGLARAKMWYDTIWNAVRTEQKKRLKSQTGPGLPSLF